jgi:predicted amino acid dehydrogenase
VSSAWKQQERGGARLKALFAFVVLIAMIYAAVKIVPAYVTEYQLQDSMQEEATFATINRKTADAIKSDVEQKLTDLGIQADPSTIQVTAYSGNVTISLEYTVPVDLTLYQLQLHFHPHAYNASL